MPIHGKNPADKRSNEIAHLIRDKGYSRDRAVAAAYNIVGEELDEMDDEEDLMFREDGPDAASPRFDEQELRRLLELCRESRR